MIPTKGSTVVIVTTEPKVPWSRVPVAGVHNRLMVFYVLGRLHGRPGAYKATQEDYVIY
jgi:hypothetical protein